MGGSIFYLTVLRPALSQPGAASARATLEQAINRAFRDVVDISIVALIVTGIVITFDRLQSAPITTTYFVVLGLKIAAALAMFLYARDLGTRLGRVGRRKGMGAAQEPTLAATAGASAGWRRYVSPSRMILMLGLLAFFLSMLLVHVYEGDISNL
ncbi:MAG: hypothetical protein EXR49_05180 [Dehalococcoidia bacterium]|nr:hypothetical protein [Dehalococcoidia bacterium]